MRPGVYIVDIDGTIFKHFNRDSETQWFEPPVLLPHAIEVLNQMHSGGGEIILMTARPEHLRDMLEADLRRLRVPYDRLIMGVRNGCRFVINDGPCRALQVTRNELWDMGDL